MNTEDTSQGAKIAQLVPITFKGGTNRQLLNFHNELESLRISVIYLLFQPRINNFYKKYGVRIESIDDQLQDLSRKYFEYEIVEDKPRVKMHQVVDESKGKLDNGQPFMKWAEVLLPGKTVAGYQEELNELLNKPCEISI